MLESGAAFCMVLVVGSVWGCIATARASMWETFVKVYRLNNSLLQAFRNFLEENSFSSGCYEARGVVLRFWEDRQGVVRHVGEGSTGYLISWSSRMLFRLSIDSVCLPSAASGRKGCYSGLGTFTGFTGLTLRKKFGNMPHVARRAAQSPHYLLRVCSTNQNEGGNRPWNC